MPGPIRRNRGQPADKGDRVVVSSARRLPLWAIAAFALGFGLALSPNLVHVYGIHNDYEMLTFKNRGLLFHEAPHLFAIARPVAALLSNLTLLPAETIADFRWTRLFSTLTVCFLGFQMMSICVQHVQTSVLHALAVALVTFLVPAYIYSVLNAPAWATHLLPIALAFAAYAVLSRTNLQMLAFRATLMERDFRASWRQFLGYCLLRPVWGACLLLQVAFFDFPPNALILTVFPVSWVLLSRTPWPYRALIATRDIGFIGANLVLYGLVTKLLYLPFVKLVTFPVLTHPTMTKFQERITGTYQFSINTDLDAIFARLKESAQVAADLWWLPQARLHLVFAFVLLLAIVLALTAPRRETPAGESMGRAWRMALATGVPIVCFMIASAAVLFSGGGFVSYRTIAIPTAIVGVVGLWAVGAAVRRIAELLAPAFAGAIGNVAVGAVIIAAIAGNFQLNELTMRLARNEAAYFRQIIREAVARQSEAVLIVDPRPFSLPEDHKALADEKGRPIPPYELGCFSSYCLQNGAIVTILAREMGADKLQVYTNRGGEPFPDLTCGIATGTETPATTSQEIIERLKFIRSLKRLTCVPYSLVWHDLTFQQPL